MNLTKTFKEDFNFWILRITALFWILYKTLSFSLWNSETRTFPLVPFVNQINEMHPRVFEWVLGLNFIFLIFILFRPKVLWVVCVLITECVLILADQLRLQPTIYQYILTFSFFLFRPKYFRYYVLLLLSAIYILSGLYKLNLGYANFVWGKFILHDTLGVSSDISNHPITKGFGLVLPILELMAGVLLLSKWRKFAFCFLILMHVILLLILGPLGANWNSVVWPWNIQMIIFAILYLNYFQNSWSWIRQSKFQLGLILVILIGLPVLGVFQKSLSQFSFNLYGGLTRYLYVSISEDDNPDSESFFITKTYNSEIYINIYEWSREELNVPYINNRSYFEGFISQYKKLHPEKKPSFILSSYPYRVKNVEEIHQ